MYYIFVQEKAAEIQQLTKDLANVQKKYDEARHGYQTNESRVQILEEMLKKVNKSGGFGTSDLSKYLDAANSQANVIALTKENDYLKDRLEGETDARRLLDDHVKIIREEVDSLRHEFNQAEKDKLEAQTRLEVLSTYFKEKELQLQK